MQLDYSDASFKLTRARAGPRPAAESAHVCQRLHGRREPKGRTNFWGFEAKLVPHTKIRDVPAHSAFCGSFGKQQFGTKFFLGMLRDFGLNFDAPPRQLLPHRAGAPPQQSVTAVLASRREALCLSSCRSFSLPSSSQRWAEAASFLHGVCRCCSKFQQLPFRRLFCH